MTRTTLVMTLLVALLGGATTTSDPDYPSSLRALFAELDAGYPFFDVKGIRKEWGALKKELLARAKRCRSDAEFVDVVHDAIAGLRDGHAFFDTEVKGARDHPDRYYPGLIFLPASKKRVVVLAAPPGLETVLPVGTVVTRIDGKDARTVLDRDGDDAWKKGGAFSSPQRARFFAWRIPLTGPRGAKHTLHFLDGRRERKRVVRSDLEIKGWMHNFHLPELTPAAKSVGYARLEGAVGYVYLRRMDRSVLAGLRAALDANPDATGWVIDLRGNTGGGYDQELVKTLTRLKGRVAGIIDAGCVSAGETFARDLVRQAKARLFGAVSAGSSSSKKNFELPGGLGTVRYSVRSRSGVKGPIEFHGITPDESVEADPESIAAGKNPSLERALAWVRKG